MDASSLSLPAMRSFDPARSQAGSIYKLMTGIIVPRPVALVSTVDGRGAANLAPFSFFTGVGDNPPSLLFCPALRAAGAAVARKDTLSNVEQTREFVVNVTTSAIAGAARATAAEVGPEVDEFELAGLTPIASEVVRPPRVAESPAQIECRLLHAIYTGRGPGSGVVVLGEIVRIHVREDLVSNFRVDPGGLDAVGLLAGNSWLRTGREPSGATGTSSPAAEDGALSA